MGGNITKEKAIKNLEVTGKVVHGDKVGRKLGFPTANLEFNGDDAEGAADFGAVADNHGVYLVKYEFPDNQVNAPEFPDPPFTSPPANIPNTGPALLHLGTRSTFGEEIVKWEVYLMISQTKQSKEAQDFPEFYGNLLSISLIARLRGTRKFDSMEELVQQMERDEKTALEKYSRLW